MAHPPELRQKASELRSEKKLIREIAVELGVPKPTVTRWLNEEFERRERANARRRKFSHKRRCPRCSRKMSDKAQLCATCRWQAQTDDRYWTRERIIDAMRVWALQHGHAPTLREWQRSGKGRPAAWTVTGGKYPPFSSWSEAIKAAGFNPRQKRSNGRLSNEARAALRRQRREDALKLALEKENNAGTVGKGS